MITSGSVLVIDDRPEDGKAIGNVLWENNISCLFFHYDVEKLEQAKQNNKKHTGVRVIFQDIQLVGGGGTPTKTDYDAAADTIDALLSDQNGPWLLITWSTWSDEKIKNGSEGENDDKKHPEQLFTHLKKELKETKQPFFMLTLNKDDYTSEPHGPVGDLSGGRLKSLSDQINELLPATKHLDAMWGWEYAIKDSAAGVICHMASLAHLKAPASTEEPPINSEDDLAKLDGIFAWMIKELASAEAGSTEDHAQLARGFETVLHNLHLDRLKFSKTIPTELLKEDISSTLLNPERLSEWKRRVNRILHFSFTPDAKNVPGCLYNYDRVMVYPKPRSLYKAYGDLYNEDNLKNQFLECLKSKPEIKDIYKEFAGKTSLVFVDITPPCDLANQKAKLRKFCIGIKIPLPTYDAIAEESRMSKRRKVKDTFRNYNWFWTSPIFSLETSDLGKSNATVLVIDLRLVCSFPDSEDVRGRLQSTGRIKEQLLGELISTIGPHMTRPGIVSLE